MDSTVLALVIVFIVILVSMSLHEMMHALASDLLGDPTARLMGRVSPNPIRHIDPFLTIALPLLMVLAHSPVLFGAAKPVQVNFNRLRYGEYGGAIVGMIGPLTNFVIAVVAAGIFNILKPDIGLGYKILGYTILVNIGFFIFNSIPWPPLDGSRLLYAFAPRGLQSVMEQIEGMGMMGLIIFVFIFYYSGGTIFNIIAKLAGILAPGLNFNYLVS